MRWMRSVAAVAAAAALCVVSAAPSGAAPFSWPDFGSSGSSGPVPGGSSRVTDVDVTAGLSVLGLPDGATVTYQPYEEDDWSDPCVYLTPEQRVDPKVFSSMSCGRFTVTQAFYEFTVTAANGYFGSVVVRYDMSGNAVTTTCLRSAFQCAGSTVGYENDGAFPALGLGPSLRLGPPGFTQYAVDQDVNFSVDTGFENIGSPITIAYGAGDSFIYGTVTSPSAIVPCRIDAFIDFGPDAVDPAPTQNKACWVAPDVTVRDYR